MSYAGHIEEVGPQELAARASSLSAWCDVDPPTEGDLRWSLLEDTEQICLVAGEIGAAVVVPRFNCSAVKYLAVDPRSRREGIGSALLDAIEERGRAAGHGAVIFGACPPGYLWPGVELGLTSLETRLFGRGYKPVTWAVNQEVVVPGTLAVGAARLAEPGDADAVKEFCLQHYPNWEAETAWSFSRGLAEIGSPRCAVWYEDDELLGFACWSVTRDGWFGPMATRPDLREGRNSRGVGTGTLAVALAGLADEGRTVADISWVGPERFYARAAGARAYRAFRVFTLSLA